VLGDVASNIKKRGFELCWGTWRRTSARPYHCEVALRWKQAGDEVDSGGSRPRPLCAVLVAGAKMKGKAEIVNSLSHCSFKRWNRRFQHRLNVQGLG